MRGFRGRLAVTVTGGLEEVMTPWAGASILVESYRRCGVGEAADRALPRKKTSKGLSQGQMTEAFVLLSALGGECTPRYGKAAAGQRIGGDVRLSDAGAGDRPPMAR